MALMVLELILFLRSQRISGLSLDQHLACSKWESALMVIQLTLDHTKDQSQPYLITLCTILLTMSSVMVNTWEISSHVTTLKHLTSLISMPLVCLWITTTMLVSYTIIQVQRQILKTRLFSHSQAMVFHLSIMVLNSITKEETIHRIVNLCGKRWTPHPTSTKLSKR